MEEAEIHEKQVTAAQSEISELLTALGSSASREADLEQCDEKLAACKHALEALRVALGDLKGAEREAMRKVRRTQHTHRHRHCHCHCTSHTSLTASLSAVPFGVPFVVR